MALRILIERAYTMYGFSSVLEVRICGKTSLFMFCENIASGLDLRTLIDAESDAPKFVVRVVFFVVIFLPPRMAG